MDCWRERIEDLNRESDFLGHFIDVHPGGVLVNAGKLMLKRSRLEEAAHNHASSATGLILTQELRECVKVLWIGIIVFTIVSFGAVKDIFRADVEHGDAERGEVAGSENVSVVAELAFLLSADEVGEGGAMDNQTRNWIHYPEIRISN